MEVIPRRTILRKFNQNFSAFVAPKRKGGKEEDPAWFCLKRYWLHWNTSLELLNSILSYTPPTRTSDLTDYYMTRIPRLLRNTSAYTRVFSRKIKTHTINFTNLKYFYKSLKHIRHHATFFRKDTLVLQFYMWIRYQGLASSPPSYLFKYICGHPHPQQCSSNTVSFCESSFLSLSHI